VGRSGLRRGDGTAVRQRERNAMDAETRAAK
jgi:hypothetical protein